MKFTSLWLCQQHRSLNQAALTLVLHAKDGGQGEAWSTSLPILKSIIIITIKKKGIWEESEVGDRHNEEFREVPEQEGLDREELAGWGDPDWDQAATTIFQAWSQLNLPFPVEKKWRQERDLRIWRMQVRRETAHYCLFSPSESSWGKNSYESFS